MSYTAFLENPWRNSAPAYGEAFFQHYPSPEYATGEVLLSSLYRSCGFATCGEKDVPAAGREFIRRCSSVQLHGQSGSELEISEWTTVVQRILESPKQANQSSKRLLQMSPLIPDIALYSGAARTTGNPWNPGKLVQNIISLGSKNPDDAQDLWAALAGSLEVVETDDIWARWLQHEFQLRASEVAWQRSPLQADVGLNEADCQSLHYPARSFCASLRALLRAKSLMTRRQWISLLEATLRLGGVSHILWLNSVHDRLWSSIRQVLLGEEAPSLSEVQSEIISLKMPFLSCGDPAMPVIRNMTSRYLLARLSINAVLWKLAEIGQEVEVLSGCDKIAEMLKAIESNRVALEGASLMADIQRAQDENAKLISCKKGIGANVLEFCRYVLGQRQTADPTLRGYDQGYYLRKKGDYSAAQFIVSLGPVALLAAVHCCLDGAIGPRSIHSLCRHLAAFGLELDKDDVISGELGQKLRALGLVLDSPDAESGMLLVQPFN
jgi:hypothetical protein